MSETIETIGKAGVFGTGLVTIEQGISIVSQDLPVGGIVILAGFGLIVVAIYLIERQISRRVTARVRAILAKKSTPEEVNE